ncbi:MAG: response regulator [Limisphaerales bacterium]
METQLEIAEGASSLGREIISILLVDDESRNLDVLESILASPELRLVRTQTPDHALLKLVQDEFACIVLDIQLPTMSGIELARLIKTRKRCQHIPIIFLTAFFQEEKDILQGYGVGAVDYLTKPLNPKILKSKVGVFVDLFKTTRALAKVNAALEMEIVHRLKAEEALQQINSELEERVQKRTAELKLAHDELLAASRAKDEFMATLSHELRTPLNPVLLVASDAVHDSKLSVETRAHFDMIRKNVELEARLIDDLLDLTRITRGKIILDQDYLDAHVILRDAIATVQEDIKRKQISLTLKLNAAKHTIFGDAVRIQQIFWNLLKNATKFTLEKGGITIETETLPDDSKIAVKISDTGIGMMPEEISRLFTIFSQGNHVSGKSVRRFGGLGLGLAISQKLVELHSGQIHATSEGLDKGSVFIVELPLAPTADTNGNSGDVAHASKNSPAASPLATAGIRVLLVEDHEPTRTALEQLLTRRDYKVATAASIAEARTLAGAGNFHLLISDIGLPDGSGYDLMAELKKNSPVKGIALTGYGMDQDLARSYDAGFVAHLTKPVRVQSLEAALNAANELIQKTARINP